MPEVAFANSEDPDKHHLLYISNTVVAVYHVSTLEIHVSTRLFISHMLLFRPAVFHYFIVTT